MSSGIEHLMKQVRVLSYQDMMVVAEELAKTLREKKQDKLDGHVIATALLGLSVNIPGASEITQRDNEIIRKIFSRKRQILVSPRRAGYELEVSQYNGSQVVGTDLRVMFPMLLDQIVTLHVL